MSKMDLTKSHAEAAKFHMNFAIMMLNSGRLDEANESFAKADEQLTRAIADQTQETEK